jgi:CBS domain-containing protein
VYCYDTECDLSARGAALLEAYGFTDVYDHRGSKTEWMGLGHQVEGTTPRSVRAGTIARTDVGRIAADATLGEARALAGGEGSPVVVVDGDGVVIGAIRPDSIAGDPDSPVVDVLQPGPPTVRPGITAAELAESMDDEGQDHVLVTHLEVATPYVDFLRGLGPDGILATPVRTVRDTEVPSERTVLGIAGWQRSLPIRVGNDARGQVQYDALGFVLEAVDVHLRDGGRFDRRLRSIVTALADRCAEDDEQETSGIWELRDPGDLVAADIGRWIALDRAVRITQRRRPWHSTHRWRRARARVRERVLAAISEDGRLPQRYDSDVADASCLLLVVLQLVPPRSAHANALIDTVRRDLGAGPFVHRYPPTLDDGFHGREGAFVPVSWWLVSAPALADRLDEAADVADGLCDQLPDLMPEEWDPARSEALGNTPLVWAHMEAGRALHLLDGARRHRRLWSRRSSGGGATPLPR